MGKVFSPVTLSNFSWGVPGILRPGETYNLSSELWVYLRYSSHLGMPNQNLTTALLQNPSDHQAPQLISKAKLSHHMKETHCGHLYSQPYPRRFYPDIMTKGKELNMDLKSLHLWSQLSRHHNNIALFFLVENHGRRL